MHLALELNGREHGVNTRTSEHLGTWIATVTLLLGLAAWSVPAAAASLIGTVLLLAVGALLLVVGTVNLRQALRLDGRDVGPTLLTTLLPAGLGGLLLFLGTAEHAGGVAVRGLGALAAVSGVLLLVPPPRPLVTTANRLGRRHRATAAR